MEKKRLIALVTGKVEAGDIAIGRKPRGLNLIGDGPGRLFACPGLEQANSTIATMWALAMLALPPPPFRRQCHIVVIPWRGRPLPKERLGFHALLHYRLVFSIETQADCNYFNAHLGRIAGAR